MPTIEPYPYQINPLTCTIGELELAIDYHRRRSDPEVYGTGAHICREIARDYSYALEGRGAVDTIGLPILFRNIWHLDIVMTWIPQLNVFSMGEANELYRDEGSNARMTTKSGRIVALPNSMNYLIERENMRIDSFKRGRYSGPKIIDRFDAKNLA